MIKLGTSEISKVYFGANEITKAYLGSTEVYSSGYGTLVDAWIARATALSYTIPAAGTLSVLQTQLANIGDTTLAKMDVLHIYSPDAGTMDFFTLNAVAPSAFQATLVNAPTTSVNGVLTNGSNYVDTGVSPNDLTEYTLDDAHFSVYLSQDVVDNGSLNSVAAIIDSPTVLAMIPAPNFVGGRDYSAMNSSGSFNTADSNLSAGLKTVQRVNSSETKTYQDGVLVSTLNEASTTIPTINMYLGFLNRLVGAAFLAGLAVTFFGDCLTVAIIGMRKLGS